MPDGEEPSKEIGFPRVVVLGHPAPGVASIRGIVEGFDYEVTDGGAGAFVPWIVRRHVSQLVPDADDGLFSLLLQSDREDVFLLGCTIVGLGSCLVLDVQRHERLPARRCGNYEDLAWHLLSGMTWIDRETAVVIDIHDAYAVEAPGGVGRIALSDNGVRGLDARDPAWREGRRGDLIYRYPSSNGTLFCTRYSGARHVGEGRLAYEASLDGAPEPEQIEVFAGPHDQTTLAGISLGPADDMRRVRLSDRDWGCIERLLHSLPTPFHLRSDTTVYLGCQPRPGERSMELGCDWLVEHPGTRRFRPPGT